MFSNLVGDALGALFAPLLRFLKEMLGIGILCGGGGGILTAASMWDLGYVDGYGFLIISTLCAGLFLIGMVMAPGLHPTRQGSFTERLRSRRAMRKYLVDDN